MQIINPAKVYPVVIIGRWLVDTQTRATACR